MGCVGVDLLYKYTGALRNWVRFRPGIPYHLTSAQTECFYHLVFQICILPTAYNRCLVSYWEWFTHQVCETESRHRGRPRGTSSKCGDSTQFLRKYYLSGHPVIYLFFWFQYSQRYLLLESSKKTRLSSLEMSSRLPRDHFGEFLQSYNVNDPNYQVNAKQYLALIENAIFENHEPRLVSFED